jgi:signal transduction histidine kinase
LSIVKSLVELHGGTISLVSTPGHGTEVRALLPLVQEEALAESEPAPRRYVSSR